MVDIASASPQTNPKIQLFSQMFTIDGVIICAEDMVYSYSWQAKFIDSNDYSLNNNIDLTGNPSSFSSEILIDAFSLSYGLYEFMFQLKGVWKGTEKLYSKITYQKIIPTGLAIFGLLNGVSCSMIGSKQGFILDPAQYSFDFDYVVSIKTLKFDFNCRKLFKNQSNEISSWQYLNNTIEYSNDSFACFNSPGNCSFYNRVYRARSSASL